MASAQLELSDRLQNGTSATLINQTMANMQLIRSHSWDGRFAAPGLPPTIRNHDVARFTHLKGNQGSKAAVIYSITTATGQPGAIILGWSAPANFNPSTSPNKVYGVSGPKGLIDSLTWDQIERALDEVVTCVEIKNGICIYATILNNPIAKMADLQANFSFCPRP